MKPVLPAVRRPSFLLLVAFYSGLVGTGLVAKEAHVHLAPGKKLILKPGESGDAQVWLRIDPGFHAQANPAANPSFIPTTLSALVVGGGLKIGDPIYPKGEPYRLKGTTQDLSVYKGAVAIQVPVQADAQVASGKFELKGKLRYQACDDQICFFPETVDVSIPVEVRK